MRLSYEDAVKRLTGGEPLDTLLLSLRPDSEVGVQRRAAIVRWFDRETFDAFGEGADFDAFVKQTFVEPVPGATGVFRIRDDYRRTVMDGWAGTDEWRAAHADLAAFFARRLPGGSVDELCHLSALGSEREGDASRLFVQLFDQADAKFDLSKSAELLEIVADPVHRHSEGFLEIVKARRCRLRARQMWSDEFFRTTAYHERQPITDGLDLLMRDPTRWILQIYAGGGMGKTMCVRWMLARHFVPQGIPCARLDFDFERPEWLSERPWRLVLKIARQLNEQMPDAPFTELVKEYGDAEAEEDISSEDAAQDFERAQSNDKRLNPQAFSRLTWALLEGRSAPPVIVFDTLERVSLYYQKDLLDLIARFAAVQHDYKALRLILAGRYDLGGKDKDGREHIPGFTAQSGAQTLSLPVQPFSEPEARHYLISCRGIPDDGRAQAIIDRSAGVPFKLSLFATIVQDDPTLDETAIRTMEHVNVEFLIKRVVDQIKEPLAQWVLRHGVVPRQLTKTFLRDVMIPLLQDIQRGRTTVDTGRDQLPDHLQKDDRFRTDLLTSPTDTISADDMWTTLNRYATDYSWISQSKEWPDTLVFHTDVVDAMRTLLQAHEAFDRLHEEAIRYYEARALAEPGNWTRWTREVIYHRFQKGGPDAAASWRTALRQKAPHGAGAMRELAEEILGPEYVDETGAARLRRDDTPMVPLDLLIAANYEAARNGVEAARLRRAAASDQAWFTADRRIKEAQRLQETTPATVILTPIATVVVRAAIELVRKPEEALRMLTAARKEVTPDFVSPFEELCGDAWRPADLLAASEHFRLALDSANDEAMATPRVRSLTVKLAECAARTGDYALTIATAQRALAAAEPAGDAEVAGTARVRLADAQLAAGNIGQAIALCGEGNSDALELPDPVRASLDAVHARAALAAGDPLGAWNHARRQFPRAFDQRVESDPTFRDATGLELKGELHATLFEFEEALAAWRDARHAWDILREPDGALRCLLRSVRTMVRDTRELAAAAQMMSEAERMASSLGSHASFAYRRTEVERRAVAEPDRAAAVLDTILDAPNVAATCDPSVAVAAAKQSIALKHRLQDAAALLQSTLQRVTPPAARLSVLNPRDQPLAPSNLPADGLRPLLLSAVDTVAAGDTGVTAFLLDALESLRWLGETERAGRIAGGLAERLEQGHSLFSLLPLREVLRRLDLDRDGRLDPPAVGRTFLKEFDQRPRACGVFLLSETEIRIARDGWHPNKVRLTEIDRYLGDRAVLPASLKARVDQVNPAAAPKTRSAKPPSGSAPDPSPPVLPVPVSALAAMVALGRPTVSIAFGRRDDRSTITRDGGAPVERSIERAFKQLTGTSAGELTKAGLAAPVDLADRLARDPRVSIDIAHLLFDDGMLGGISGAVDLRIGTGHSIYGGIPWELARTVEGKGGLLVSHPKIRCIYRCVSDELSGQYLIASAQQGLVALHDAKLAVDGIMGPKTAASIRGFQSRHGLPPTGGVDAATHAAITALRYAQADSRQKSVVIVRRGYRAQAAQVRGVYFSTFDAVSEYKRAGWQVVTLEDPTKAAIKDAVAKSHAAVVHVNAPVAENTRTGGLYLDVGRDIEESSARVKANATVRRAQGLPVADLVECLGGPGRDLAPVVVLDPPGVPIYSEAVRQLILRNAFASDVFQHGATPAIVCTGLLQGDEHRNAGSSLVEGFTSGQPLAAVCGEMRRAARPNPPGSMQFSVTTALYTHYADYAPWRPVDHVVAR